MRYGSVCSGVEAASLAWESLGWQPAWFAEIEPFPAAVLNHHWPHVPNYGDMTKLEARILSGEIEAPDILVGGTPCQAFSVAGLRNSLDDERGNLTLVLVRILNAIDRVRKRLGKPPAILVWENVPGVLNTKDNAFGSFLAGLAGEELPLEPAGKRWTNAGCVFGEQRNIAWRVLDAQYFGVAQRRRRVFLVASGGGGVDPAEVLFERPGLRGDSSPGFAPCQDAAGAAGSGAAAAGWYSGYAGLKQPYGKATVTFGFGGGNTAGPIDVAACLTAAPGPKNDFEVETFVAQSIAGSISHTLSTANGGKGCSEDGTGKGVPIIAFTAGVRDDQQADARRAGANDVLPKPMDLDQMASLLARWVKPRPAPAAEAAPPPTGSDAFPDIDGIDAARAARRLGGDRAMFTGLLQLFVTDNRDAAGQTRAFLATGDREAAARRMHTLRSNAGFICALDLMASAGELEKAIEAGADATDLDARLDAIGAEIDALVAACAPWL